MKRVLLLLIMALLLITVPFCISAFAEEGESVTEIGDGEGEVSLSYALTHDGVYRLSLKYINDGGGYENDFRIYSTQKVTANVTLILNRVEIYATGSGFSEGDYMFEIQKGASLTIKNEDHNSSGTVETRNAANLAGIFKVDGTVGTADTEDPATLIIEGGSYSSAGSVIATEENSYVEIDYEGTGTKPSLTSRDEAGAAILHNGGALKLYGGTINGKTGVYMTGGELDVCGAKVTASGAYTEYSASPTFTGDALAIDNTRGEITSSDISIAEGYFSSSYGSPIAVYAQDAQNKIGGFVTSCSAYPTAKFDTSLIVEGSEICDGKIAISAGLSGEGTEESPYLIQSLDDLIALRDSVDSGHSYYEKYILLTADIDLASESPWDPIGTASTDSGATHYFRGTFDGDGHVISNLYINLPGEDYVGFFSCLSADALIKDLVLDGVSITGDRYVGGIVGGTLSYGMSIEGCTVKGMVSGANCVGGIGGECDTVTDCVNYASVTAAENYVGGIVADATTVRNCVNYGTVTGASFVGGVAATVETVTGCVNNGTVSAASASSMIWLDKMRAATLSAAGGIAAVAYEAATDCENNGRIEGEALGVGGIVGLNYQGEISGCTNTGDIKGGLGKISMGEDWSYDSEGNEYLSGETYLNGSAAGGICGLNASVVENCVNTGTVEGMPTTETHYSYGYDSEGRFITTGEQTVSLPISTSGGIAGVSGAGESSVLAACISMGTVGENASGVAGLDYMALVTDGQITSTENSYYLSDSETADGGRTAEQFANGQVAYELSGSERSQWGQDVTDGGSLSLGASPVYKNPVTEQYTNTLSVVFDSEGGTSTDALHGLTYGQKLTEPTAPVREGYSFLGWYIDAECTVLWDFENDTVTDVVYLYAGFMKNNLKVVRGGGTFYFDNLTDCFAALQDGDTVTLLDNFTAPMQLSFYTDEQISLTIDLNGKTIFFTEGFGILSFYGYDLTIKGEGTIDAILMMDTLGSITVKGGTYKVLAVTANATAVLEGGLFTGLTEAESAAFSSSGDELMRLYAAILGTNGIIFAYTEDEALSLLVMQGFVDTYHAYSKELFTLDLSAFGMTGCYAAAAPLGTKILNRYTVTFDVNELFEAPDGQIITEGESITEPTLPSVAGRIFIGWYTNSSYTEAFDVISPITRDITLYAKYASYAEDIEKIYGELGDAKSALEEAIASGDEDLKAELSRLNEALKAVQTALELADAELEGMLLSSKTEMLSIIALGDKQNSDDLESQIQALQEQLAQMQTANVAIALVVSLAAGGVTLFLATFVFRVRKRRYY